MASVKHSLTDEEWTGVGLPSRREVSQSGLHEPEGLTGSVGSASPGNVRTKARRGRLTSMAECVLSSARCRTKASSAFDCVG